MKELAFYDHKRNVKFVTTDYVIKEIRGRCFAITKPEGKGRYECWRAIPKNQAEELRHGR